MDSSFFSCLPMVVFEAEPSPSKDTFLLIYPTTLHSSTSNDYLRVYWSHDDPQLIQDKVRCAFQNLQLPNSYAHIIQFWAPVNVCGRHLLTTCDQPFALYSKGHSLSLEEHRLHCLEEHRLHCLEYQYNINVNKVEVFEEDPTILTDGPPASAFLNRTPELLLINDTTIHLIKKKNTLLSSVPKYGLAASSFVVPVFDPYKTGDCVGVVECFTFFTDDLIHAFNELNIALEDQGLKTFHAKQHLPYKTICGLQNAKDEIEEALEIILQEHGLPLSQVWIPYEDNNQAAFSSSLQDIPTKQILWLKLTSHICEALLVEQDLKCLAECSTAHDRLPMKSDVMFAGKTFENYEPLFIQDILELDDDNPKRLVVYDEGRCSSFMICLRSTKSGDLDYVFEFLWNPDQCVILLELLLLTLEKYLPSFKFASGTKLSDEIDILDVKNSEGSEKKYIKIFQRNKASLKRGRQSEVEEFLMPSKPRGKTTPIELTRKQIESQFGQTLEEAAPKLNVSMSTLKRNCNRLGIKWHGKDRSKRNKKHSYKNQSNTNGEEDQGGAIQDPSLAMIRDTSLDEIFLTIKAEYANDVIKFTLPFSSATYEAIREEIVKKFELDHSAHYKLEYLDDEDKNHKEWILFKCDEDVMLCTKNKRNIRLRVLQRDPPGTYQLT